MARGRFALGNSPDYLCIFGRAESISVVWGLNWAHFVDSRTKTFVQVEDFRVSRESVFLSEIEFLGQLDGEIFVLLDATRRNVDKISNFSSTRRNE